ncbi:MAG: class I tRNA ligase family protein, partial [Clostridia bacterium]|nr:class I tRNA ligase family protein [Clostridia bacterium]
YKNVIVLGHVLDKNGQKMSKSKGNAVDPFEALEKHGADAIRWYFYSGSAPWLHSRFHDDAVTEGQRKFMSTLWNTYAFFVLYANIDEFDATKYTLDYDKLSVMDKWVLSKLNTVVKSVDNCLEHYKITETTRILQDFIDDLSNWYVRRSRERFWVPGMPQDKVNAYMTLYTCLVTFAKVCAPMIPFMTEDIYRNLVCTVDKEAPISVHLCDYPAANEALIDSELEERMDEVLKVVALGRACRNGAAIKNRQPLSKMYVAADFTLPEFFTEIIEEELNLKAVEFTSDISAFTSYTFKPQLRTVGPKYGKHLGGIKAYLSAVDGNAAMAELEATGALKFEDRGEEIVLTKEDLLIDSAKMPGYESVADYGITVVIDTNLTEELIEEGFVREIVSKIQTMRKDSGFEVMDNINITVSGDAKVVAIAEKNAEFIMGETLGKSLVNEEKETAKEWDINGKKVKIAVEKI